MNDSTNLRIENEPDRLTGIIQSKLANPERSSDIDLHGALNDVLKDVGLSTADSGGKITFYGRDPIIPSLFRFGSMSAIALAAKAVGVAALWRLRTGEEQDIEVDVRKALRRFAGFFDLKWETINGRPPALEVDTNLFRETRDGRHVVPLNIYPKLAARELSLLRCDASPESVRNAILQWRADDLENAAAEAGIVIAKVRTFEEFRKELQYTEVLSRMSLINVEKIGESEPIPFKKDGTSPLDGIRALRNGSRDCRSGHRAETSLCTGPMSSTSGGRDDSEIEAFAWDAQVGMRSTILDYSKEDRARFDHLLKDADVFFANKRPGYLERHGLDAEELCAQEAGVDPCQCPASRRQGPLEESSGIR